MIDKYYTKALALHGECFVCDTHWDLAPEIFMRNLAGEKNILKNRCLDDLKKGGFSPGAEYFRKMPG
ncbi:MAG: hypothetical protein LBP69_02595 [Treponema sp.]|jgi:hypothetical protein|nr:hypothetical protein [Treponema sp.]